MFGHAQDMHPPGAYLHDEQHIQPSQADGVDMEEIGGQQPFGLGSQEGPPRRIATPSGGRAELGCRPDPPYRPGTNPVADAEEFALDTAVAPAGILPGQPHHRSLISSLTGGRPARFG